MLLNPFKIKEKQLKHEKQIIEQLLINNILLIEILRSLGKKKQINKAKEKITAVFEDKKMHIFENFYTIKL
jgi:hypothetical protein